jgi:magnesium-transporting ATPase (P-type)
MSRSEAPTTKVATEEEGTRREIAQVKRTLTMTSLASILILAAGGLTLIFAGRAGAAVGSACAGVYLLINLWLLVVEAPAGLKRSRNLCYEDLTGIWRSISFNSAVLIVILGGSCILFHLAMQSEKANWKFWLTAGLIMTISSACLIGYKRHMNKLLDAYDKQLRSIGTLEPSSKH